MRMRENDRIQGVSLKAGVSLVTVLLFMLVATIAATATYKWLSSEGRSSSSRLQQNEAQQSALAGIESARAWMTYNANDVGALIKQYKEKGPINITPRLKPWLRANQEYEVWLTGVNTGTAHNFKLKIVSSGKSSGGAVHNEGAIFNVDGLYQVILPSESSGIGFDKAFQGSVGKFVSTDRVQSAIVNGDYSGNQPQVDKEFIVTGSVKYEGKTVVPNGGDIYIGGNLEYSTKFEVGSATNNVVVYVGGNLICPGGEGVIVHGDLLVEGNIPSTCKIDVSGSLTVGGTLSRGQGGEGLKIGKALVFKEEGEFKWEGVSNYSTQGVPNNVVGSATYLSKISGMNSDGQRKIPLGKKVYLYSSFPSDIHACQNSCNKPEYTIDCTDWWGNNTRCPTGFCEGFFSSCQNVGGVNIGKPEYRYFSFYSPEASGRVQTQRVQKWSPTDNVLKNIGFNYWNNIDKMSKYGSLIDSETGEVPVAILLNNYNELDENSWINKTYNCDLYKKIDPAQLGGKRGFDTEVVKQINQCYIDASTEGKLYNGFLVLNLSAFSDGAISTEELDGKFVFIMNGNPYQLRLPPTKNDPLNSAKDAVVMLYFPNGWGSDIMPASTSSDYFYNYFIYSNGTIKQFLSFGDKKIQGSVVLASGQLETSQGGSNITYKKTVLEALSEAGFIKENPEFTERVNGTTSSTPSSGFTGGPDEYYIAMAPQLYITLESQYKNNEPLPVDDDDAELSPSFIILPRVVYLPTNPYGRLSDYYNVVNLNPGTTLVEKQASRMDCKGAIPSGEALLYDRAQASPTPLTPGLHECVYTDPNIGGDGVKFFVKVSDATIGNGTYVNFEKNYQEMGTTFTDYVKLVYPAGTNEAFKIKVHKLVSSDASWSITKVPGVPTEGACDESSTECVFTLQYDNGSPKSLFEVKTTNATAGTFPFQLECMEGCLNGEIDLETFAISSAVDVHREGLSAYCNLSGVSCSEEYVEMADNVKWPDCPTATGTWVKAVGFNSTTLNVCSAEPSAPNDQWQCGISSDIKLELVSDGVPSGCTAVIPAENNYLSQTTIAEEKEGTLYAQLKANKVSFHVGFAGEELSGKTIIAKSNRWPDEEKSCTYSSENDCVFNLFYGDKITLSVAPSSKADFSYWKCDPGTSANCTSAEPFTGDVYQEITVAGDNNFTAWFGQRDKHCFFDEFKTAKECTGSGDGWKYCFNYCESSSDCRIGNGVLTDNAKWLVIGDLGLRNKMHYEDGRIWLESSHNRGRSQENVDALKVMSTAQAGLYGTLLAQFQVPRIGKGDDGSLTQAMRSGILLHSNNDATSYLMLNVYAKNVGGNWKLAAKACVGNNCSNEVLFKNANNEDVSVGLTDIVTLTAVINKSANGDKLVLSVVDGYYGNYNMATAPVINLHDIAGYSALTTRENEYVGFSLADPNFKIYDIGWKSDDYNAECWDTPPTIKCSFRAAYLGGIVPQNQSAKPWVGLSSWFNGKDCAPQYWYKGDDACGRRSDEYSDCGDSYTFASQGSHGTIVGGVDNLMAKVGVDNCSGTYLLDHERELAYTGEAKCGAFWVGEINNCKKNVEFFKGSESIADDEAKLFALESGVYANLRGASIQILMNNAEGAELEVYLKSETESGYYASKVMLSRTASTKNTTMASFDVEELANETGFDPEKVTGVFIKNLEPSKYVTITEIKSDCIYRLKLECKDVTYNANKFTVRASVTNAENMVKSYKIKGKYNVAGESNTTAPDALERTFDCLADGCPQPNGDDIVVFFTDTYEPHKESGFDNPRHYTFTIEATDVDGESIDGSPCTAPSADPGYYEVNPLAADCKWASGSSVQEGKGLPNFMYRLPDCAGGTCKWEVVLDGSDVLRSSEGIVCGDANPCGYSDISTITGNYNIGGQKLTTGDHKIRIRPTGDSPIKFNECEQTFTVTETPPDVTCEFTVTSGKHDGGSYVTLAPAVTGCSDDCKYSINGGEYGTNLSITAPAYVGPHEYSVSVQRGTESAVPCGTYTVNVPLVGSCGANAVSGTVPPGGNITPPTPAITNCNGECRYSVTGPSGSSISNGSGYNYNGGAISTPFTDGASGLDGPVQYTLNVWHGDADGFAQALANDFGKECMFTVTYETATPPPSVCKCAKYCGSGCESNITTGNVYHNGDNWSGCVFLTSATRINIDNTGYTGYTINNNTIYSTETFCYDNPTACATKLASYGPDPDDGGWYIKIGKVYTDIQSSGYNPCATVTTPTITACPVASATLPPGGTVRITPTTTNCNVLNGCTYTIMPGATGDRQGTYYSGDITFIGESSPGGPIEYTITVRNSAGPASEPCKFNVTYSADAAKEYVYTAVFDGNGITAWQTLTEGDAKINCSALSQGHLHCKNGGTIKIDASTWNSPYDYNSLTDCHGTTLNATITGSIQCAVYRDW